MTDQPGSVLVVDDDPVVLTVLQAALQAEGLEVRTTDSVDAALTALSSWTPDLVLLDVRMPGRLGFELQHWLQQQPQKARIPVVFLTQHDSVEDRTWGLVNGAVDFISKSFLAPSSIHLLALRVRNLVMVQESQRLRGALAAVVSTNHYINNRLMVIMSAAERTAPTVDSWTTSSRLPRRSASGCNAWLPLTGGSSRPS
jgi:DNA-binding response OmpR family regulator